MDERFFITCNCSCGSSLMFSTLDGEIFIDFLSSDFYTKQNIFNIPILMALGDRNLKDIIVTTQQLLELKKYLIKTKCIEKKTQNYSHLTVFPISDSDLFEIRLVSDMPLIEILKGHSHRAYEITITESEKKKLIKIINKAVFYKRNCSEE